MNHVDTLWHVHPIAWREGKMLSFRSRWKSSDRRVLPINIFLRLVKGWTVRFLSKATLDICSLNDDHRYVEVINTQRSARYKVGWVELSLYESPIFTLTHHQINWNGNFSVAFLTFTAQLLCHVFDFEGVVIEIWLFHRHEVINLNHIYGGAAFRRIN